MSDRRWRQLTHLLEHAQTEDLPEAWWDRVNVLIDDFQLAGRAEETTWAAYRAASAALQAVKEPRQHAPAQQAVEEAGIAWAASLQVPAATLALLEAMLIRQGLMNCPTCRVALLPTLAGLL